MMNVETLSRLCLKMYNFNVKHSTFLNRHMVDFITLNNWDTLNIEMQRELTELKQGELLKYFLNESSVDELRRFPAAMSFVSEAREHSWQKMLLSDDVSEDARGIDNAADNSYNMDRKSIYKTSKHKFHKLQISDKKRHEVDIMAEFVAGLTRLHDGELVVDFGTGKGYLASILAALYELKVIGIESSEQNVCGAMRRDETLWNHFERTIKTLDENTSTRKGNFVPITKTLTCSTDLREVMRDALVNLDLSNVRTIFCGLHACGSLSCDVLRHFVKNSNAVAVCVIGCCYQMFEEEFDNDTNDSEAGEYGFPMSSLLRKKGAVIGSNARMLAMQTVERQAIPKPSRSLFFRAILQVLLWDHFESIRYEVGRITIREDTTFEIYARKALKRLQLHECIQLSSEVIQSYERKYIEWETKINMYQELRVLMAPSVECLLLLDRALYLLEQPEMKNCYLTRLFDPLKSPRCVAVVASKS